MTALPEGWPIRCTSRRGNTLCGKAAVKAIITATGCGLDERMAVCPDCLPAFPVGRFESATHDRGVPTVHQCWYRVTGYDDLNEGDLP